MMPRSAALGLVAEKEGAVPAPAIPRPIEVSPEVKEQLEALDHMH
jgi:hypothetical protein